MPDPTHQERQPTEQERKKMEEELAQLEKVAMRDVVLQAAYSIASFGYTRIGAEEMTRRLRDLSQAQLAIDSLRALMGPLGRVLGDEEIKSLRSMLSNLQLAYAAAAKEEETSPGTEGGAESSQAQDEEAKKARSKLWVPGQP